MYNFRSLLDTAAASSIINKNKLRRQDNAFFFVCVGWEREGEGGEGREGREGREGVGQWYGQSVWGGGREGVSGLEVSLFGLVGREGVSGVGVSVCGVGGGRG